MPPIATTALLNVLERLQALHLARTAEEALHAATEAACLATGSRRGMAGLADAESATTGDWYDTEQGWVGHPLRWESGRGAPGHVSHSGKPLVCNALPASADGLAEATEILKLTSFACVPLIDDAGSVLGFLEVGNKLGPYTPGDVRVLTAIARHTTIRLVELAEQGTQGGVTAPEGGVTATEGGVTATEGGVTATEGGVTVPEGEVTATLRRALAPEELPHVEGAEMAVFCRYRDSLGGDFIDVMSFSPSSAAVAIGDVSGHGIGAATLAVMAKYALRAIAASRWPPRPGEVLAEANNALELEVGEQGGEDGCGRSRFVTLEFGLLDVPRKRFTFASAGHPSPFVLRADGTTERPLLLPGPAAGVTPAFDAEPYSPETVDLADGDAVLLFTDGIAEARDGSGRFYEEVRMAQALEELGGLPAAQLLERLHADASRFAGGRLSDDAALLLVRLVPPDGESVQP